MQLTGKEIIERCVLTNVDLENAVQQQGVDIRLDKVSRVFPKYIGEGHIPASGKTKLPSYIPVNLFTEPSTEVQMYILDPGYYEITFMEGCNIPSDLVISNIKSRSSLVRCGAYIQCGQFDAGFSTDHMGCFLKVEVPIVIERGARIAQVQVFETRVVENLYKGQWQHDQQRAVQNS